MNLFDMLNELERFLPVLSGLAGHPEVGSLVARLIDLGEEEVRRRMATSGRTRSEELADAAATFATFKAENEALKKLGHEEDA